ncbi:MAG: bacillithiol system redox-active protein YtxJ [Candidatus Eisenbacteria bacterium]|uniref:Bacillithiol system redox-active protein YtxJ n=1 Tax=Eiseniibacteriota bacterium TaxID=2212470 RepID=A0A7Y2E5Y0_UNCEI|nr:bacillithiol system redox-active protein YtxJ [Candidatus Eisenbacteria bacterium]
MTQLPVLDESKFESIKGEPRAVIFKHSNRCSISSNAHREVSKYLKDHPESEIFLIDVVAQRPLSNAVADHLGVRHESPQILLLKNGSVAWHISHFDITAKALQNELAS